MSAAFRNLIVWQKAFELSKKIYIYTKSFPVDERYGLVDQMRRASVSVVSNIAEWSNRWTNVDYARFLFMARGSVAELQAQILLSESFWYINLETQEELLSLGDEVMKILTTLIQKYKN